MYYFYSPFVIFGMLINKVKRRYMMKETVEIWRPVVGYEGLYEVSNMGRVRSLNYNRTGKVKVLKNVLQVRDGYLFVCLRKNGEQKIKKIHRLVAEAFIPNPDNLPQVNHKDEDKTNNCSWNLEFCDQFYNNHYSKNWLRAIPAAVKTNSKPVLQFTKTGELIAEFFSAADAERKTGIWATTISKVCLGKQKTAGSYIWKFKN